ncbi:MAG TPA: ribulose-phosphate 3-epimerase [Acidobacteriota bacterium]|jgi:ribulose-phosphate 3-epimerase|nr:ribulose-phosphate 3-epimerase [Acidobacteriota bacterium]HNR38369.1 ribulose-phosphate 3-epimerase [Acidobacteriota bacterium]HNU00807.1 ribulose-phosphate 3-epimerase [Acidobacteriota bacterium]HPB26902.1 ribulose-phosphate 3-epimerase [Acidobacteriota bacterium]HQO24773.1 ribulose-phosphate 3-epimerase [Acidobacteriota bacterium]
MNRKRYLAPSLLSADFANLESAVRLVEASGAALIHLDVMDGHFVPNLTIGPPVIRALRRITSLRLDVHLMIANPERSVDDYIAAGADMLSVHVEADPHLHRTITRIRDAGRRAGVALNPATPAAAVQEILPWLDFILVMTVNPGFGGQKFIPTVLPKIRALRDAIDRQGLDVDISVDGGVGPDTLPQLVEAGVTIAVAGAAVFGAPDPAAAIRDLQAMLQ